ELVDHDRPETELLYLADRFVVTQEVTCAQLQVFEVERGFAVLALLVGGGETGEQLLQQISVGRRELVQRRLLETAARLLVACGPFPPKPQIAEVEETVRRRIRLEIGKRLPRRLSLCVAGAVVVSEAASRFAKLVDSCGETRVLAELENELASRGPQRLVDAGEH